MERHGQHPYAEPGGERRCIKIWIQIIAQNITVTTAWSERQH
jgi:hypothetical protein